MPKLHRTPWQTGAPAARRRPKRGAIIGWAIGDSKTINQFQDNDLYYFHAFERFRKHKIIYVLPKIIYVKHKIFLDTTKLCRYIDRMGIQVNIDMMMAKRKMSLTELSQRIGISMTNLSLLKTGKVKGIRFSTLEAICRELDCQPGDILEYIPDFV